MRKSYHYSWDVQGTILVRFSQVLLQHPLPTSTVIALTPAVWPATVVYFTFSGVLRDSDHTFSTLCFQPLPASLASLINRNNISFFPPFFVLVWFFFFSTWSCSLEHGLLTYNGKDLFVGGFPLSLGAWPRAQAGQYHWLYEQALGCPWLFTVLPGFSWAPIFTCRSWAVFSCPL